MSETEAPEILEDDEVDTYEWNADELVSYAIELLGGMDADERAEAEQAYSCAVTIAYAVRDGLIEPLGITELGREHLADLYVGYENGGE